MYFLKVSPSVTIFFLQILKKNHAQQAQMCYVEGINISSMLIL